MTDKIYLNPTPALLDAHQLSPINLSQGFEDDSIVCYHHDISPSEGSGPTLVPVAPYGIISNKDGKIQPARMKDVGHKPLAILAYLAGSMRQIPPFIYTAQEMDADFNALFRVYYYRSCTVVAWSCVAQGVQFLAENADEDYAPFCVSDILANVYTHTPLSNHEELAHSEQLAADLKAHAKILSLEHPGIKLGVIKDS